jgi:hypothetical protein
MFVTQADSNPKNSYNISYNTAMTEQNKPFTFEFEQDILTNTVRINDIIYTIVHFGQELSFNDTFLKFQHNEKEYGYYYSSSIPHIINNIHFLKTHDNNRYSCLIKSYDRDDEDNNEDEYYILQYALIDMDLHIVYFCWIYGANMDFDIKIHTDTCTIDITTPEGTDTDSITHTIDAAMHLADL